MEKVHLEMFIWDKMLSILTGPTNIQQAYHMGGGFLHAYFNTEVLSIDLSLHGDQLVIEFSEYDKPIPTRPLAQVILDVLHMGCRLHCAATPGQRVANEMIQLGEDSNIAETKTIISEIQRQLSEMVLAIKTNKLTFIVDHLEPAEIDKVADAFRSAYIGGDVHE